MLDYLKKNKLHILIFAVCFTALFLTSRLYPNARWTCDCADYWQRGEFLKNSGFNLSSINGFRGYIYPAFLGFLNVICGKTAWYVINSLLITTFISIIIPYIMLGKHDYTKMNALSDIMMVILFSVFFIAIIIYPLSDFFAAFCLSLSVFFLRKFIESKHYMTKIIYALFMGSCAYWSYNTRTIYLFASITVGILFVLMIFLDRQYSLVSKFKYSFIGAASGIAGVIAAGIPQYILNKTDLGITSISVPTSTLMLDQMFWGIKYQRYDTYMPNIPDTVHAHATVFFEDPAGARLLEQSQLAAFSNWGDYFNFFVRHPIDIICIYVRHFINYIFPCWPEVYVKNLNSSKWLFGIIAITVLFIAIAAWVERSYKKYDILLYFIPIVMSAILIIPGAVEYRFSLPLYIFAFSQLCMNIKWNDFLTSVKKQKMKYIIVYAIITALCFGIWSSMLANETATKLFL